MSTQPLPRSRCRHYVFSSHDGFGLGHLRRNTQIAHALLETDPGARITIVTGVAIRPRWIGDARIRTITVPPLLKGSDGAYRNPGMAFEQAVGIRTRVFESVIEQTRPAAVIVDRHPFGLAGELQAGLRRAQAGGAALVLGLRDVLDEPTRVREELDGAGWDGVPDLFDTLLVYGEAALCDHRAEYGVPLAPIYTGWVGPARPEPSAPAREAGLLLVSAGGGGDGRPVFDLGAEVLARRPSWRGVIVAGPYAADLTPSDLPAAAAARITIERGRPSCVDLLARAGAAVQMAGYNSTVEAIACGLRPVLVPRRSPRREQAIRASRLAALGLADVVDEGAHPDEVAWLLDRQLAGRPGGSEAVSPYVDAVRVAEHAASVGLRLDGAQRAAALIADLARDRVPVRPAARSRVVSRRGAR